MPGHGCWGEACELHLTQWILIGCGVAHAVFGCPGTDARHQQVTALIYVLVEAMLARMCSVSYMWHLQHRDMQEGLSKPAVWRFTTRISFIAENIR